MTAPRRRLLIAVVLLAAAGAAGGWWAWRRTGPEPPAAPAGAPPAVAAAVEDARAAVRREPRSAVAWGRLGLVLTAHGFDDPAADCFRRAHALDPADGRWPYFLGLYLRTDARDPAAAVGFFEAAAAARHPSDDRAAAVRLRLGEQYLAVGRAADAERVFRDRLARAPADARARLGLGLALLAADRPADAAAELREATAGPQRRRALANLAAAARLTGDAAAAARYEAAAAAAPDDLPPADPYLADAAAARVGGDGHAEAAELERAGRLREAVPVLRRLAEDPADVPARVALGRVLAVLGHPAEAEPHLRAAAAADPGNVQAALLLATTLYDMARAEPDAARKEWLYRDAAAAADRAAALKPDLAMAHLTRGLAARGLGDAAGAVPHLRTAADCRPELPHVQLELLDGLIAAGLADEALARLPAAEKVVPPDDARLAAARRRLAKP